MHQINFQLKLKLSAEENYNEKSDLSELKMADIVTKLEENQTKLQKLRFQKALQQIEDPLEIRFLKKEIAQLLTIKNEFIKGIRSDKDAL